MGIIFIFLGIIFLYLSKSNQKEKAVYKKLHLIPYLCENQSEKIKIISAQNKIIIFEKFEKIDSKKIKNSVIENCYSTNIKKTAPKNLYDSLKIFYSFQLFFFLNKNNFFRITNLKNYKNKLKIILNFYDDKTFEFCFDDSLYSQITEIIKIITNIKVKNISDETLFVKKDFFEEAKCAKNCVLSINC